MFFTPSKFILFLSSSISLYISWCAALSTSSILYLVTVSQRAVARAGKYVSVSAKPVKQHSPNRGGKGGTFPQKRGKGGTFPQKRGKGGTLPQKKGKEEKGHYILHIL